MILYKAIKYKILDYCVSVFMEKLRESICIKKSIHPKNIIIGSFLRTVIYPTKYRSQPVIWNTFQNCIVEDIDIITNNAGIIYHIFLLSNGKNKIQVRDIYKYIDDDKKYCAEFYI